MLHAAIRPTSHLVYLFGNVFSKSGGPIGLAYMGPDQSIHLVLQDNSPFRSLHFSPLIDTGNVTYDVFVTSPPNISLDTSTIGLCSVLDGMATISFTSIPAQTATIYMLLQDTDGERTY